MVDLTQIFSGMDEGPEKIMNNFKKVNDALDQLGGANSINWSYSTAGIVIGSDNDYVAGGYRTAKIGNATFVYTDIVIRRKSAGKNAGLGNQITLPSSVVPSTPLFGEANEDFSWAFAGGNQISFHSTKGEPIDYPAGTQLIFHAFYMK